MPHRKLIRKVRLKFFQSEDSGYWGVSHADTIEHNEDNDAFDPFWDGEGLFHDVFEHAHEGSEFFQGDYKQNVGGEMAAMGFLFYFCEDMGIDRFPGRMMWRSHTEVAIETTLGFIREAVESDYRRGGSALRSNVPRQDPIEFCTEGIDMLIEDYWGKFKKITKRPSDRREEIYANAYHRSVTKRKIADLHRWGYLEAQRLFPRNYHNIGVLQDFITFWSKFCKQNKAEEMAEAFKYLDFYIYIRGELLSWMGVLETTEGKRIPIHTDGKPFYLDSYRDLVLESDA